MSYQKLTRVSGSPGIKNISPFLINFDFFFLGGLMCKNFSSVGLFAESMTWTFIFHSLAMVDSTWSGLLQEASAFPAFDKVHVSVS